MDVAEGWRGPIGSSSGKKENASLSSLYLVHQELASSATVTRGRDDSKKGQKRESNFLPATTGMLSVGAIQPGANLPAWPLGSGKTKVGAEAEAPHLAGASGYIPE